MVGVEVMIRGLSEAGRTLALRVLSCFYLEAFVISAHEGAYHQFHRPPPHATTTTITTTPSETIQFIFMTETSF